MKYLLWLLKVAIFFTLFAFALNNQHLTVVHWFFGAQWQAPLVLVVLCALCLGLISGVLVMLPLVGPGLATVGLFAFFGSWNELLAALILISDARSFTLPVMLLNAQSGQLGSINWGLMQAGITLSILPCALLFLLLQRYYIHGLVAGAVKA